MLIKCKNCGNIYEIDADKVDEDYIQCPICGKISKNPLKNL